MIAIDTMITVNNLLGKRSARIFVKTFAFLFNKVGIVFLLLVNIILSVFFFTGTEGVKSCF